MTSGVASGNAIRLKLAATAKSVSVIYLIDKSWNPQALRYGKNGIAALTFCEVPIEAAAR